MSKIHRREAAVNKAQIHIQAIMEDFRLTYGERVKIMAGILDWEAKFMIRKERHPGKPDMPGGLEDDDAASGK